MFSISPPKKQARRQRPTKLIGQKPPLKLKEVWAIRMRLQIEERLRDLALFNLAIDSKLRGCDVVSLRVQDVRQAGQVSSRAIVMQQKTGRPVQFEITEQTRVALTAWIYHQRLTSSDYLFPSRVNSSPHISRRQYARLLSTWLIDIGLDPSVYGTHSLRRTKASMIYRRTKNIRAVQLLLGHAKIESIVRYLGVEVDDALELAEQTEVRRSERLQFAVARLLVAAHIYCMARKDPCTSIAVCRSIARGLARLLNSQRRHTHTQRNAFAFADVRDKRKTK